MAIDKSALDMTNLEKQQLRRKKKRRLVKATPVSHFPSPLPSPPNSPSPILGEQEFQPPSRPHSPLNRPPTPIEIESDPSPHHIEPQLPPAEAIVQDAKPSSSAAPEPYPNISASVFNQLSFFPTDPITFIPSDLFNFFNLPADNDHFNTTDPNALLTMTSLHLGQALGGFSRLLNLRNQNKDQSDAINKLQTELSQLQADHSQLHNEHAKLLEEHIGVQEELATQLIQAGVNETILQDLQTQVAEAGHQNKSLMEKVTNLATERTWLLEERVARASRAEELRTQNQQLDQKIQHLTEEGSTKDKALDDASLTIKRLTEEVECLKTQAQSLPEDHRLQVIEEYRKSQELTEAVMDQYNQGYLFAKKMVADAGVNPITLGFSSDEEGEEEDARHPPDQQTAPEDPPLPGQEDPQLMDQVLSDKQDPLDPPNH